MCVHVYNCTCGRSIARVCMELCVLLAKTLSPPPPHQQLLHSQSYEWQLGLLGAGEERRTDLHLASRFINDSKLDYRWALGEDAAAKARVLPSEVF